MLPGATETLFAVARGRLMISTDGGHIGTAASRRQVTATGEPIDAVVVDPAVPGRVWAASANQLHVSNDGGVTWQTVGRPLPESHTVVRGIASDPTATTLVVTSHRGTYRSTDAGVHWALEEGNLPVHLEAGPLARDPANPGIFYVVYSLDPLFRVMARRAGWQQPAGAGRTN